MAKTTKTPLRKKIEELPKSVSIKNDVEPVLDRANISMRTFQRDQHRNPDRIPHSRLLVYAGLLNCEVDDLINSYTRVKPLVKPARKKVSLLSKAGVK